MKQRRFKRWMTLCLLVMLLPANSLSAAQSDKTEMVISEAGATGEQRHIEIMADKGLGVDELIKDLPKTFTTPEIRGECPDAVKFDVVAKIVALYKTKREVIDIDGMRAVYEDGWGLVRASNTQPALVLRFEALTRDRLDEIQTEIETDLKKIQDSFLKVLDNKNLSFLVGSGCSSFKIEEKEVGSKEIGVPVMAPLATEFYNSDDFKTEKEWLKNEIRVDVNDKMFSLNLEKFLSALHSLSFYYFSILSSSEREVIDENIKTKKSVQNLNGFFLLTK